MRVQVDHDGTSAGELRGSFAAAALPRHQGDRRMRLRSVLSTRGWGVNMLSTYRLSLLRDLCSLLSRSPRGSAGPIAVGGGYQAPTSAPDALRGRGGGGPQSRWAPRAPVTGRRSIPSTAGGRRHHPRHQGDRPYAAPRLVRAQHQACCVNTLSTRGIAAFYPQRPSARRGRDRPGAAVAGSGGSPGRESRAEAWRRPGSTQRIRGYNEARTPQHHPAPESRLRQSSRGGRPQPADQARSADVRPARFIGRPGRPALAGGRAVVVDLDPQGSATAWGALREADGNGASSASRPRSVVRSPAARVSGVSPVGCESVALGQIRVDGPCRAACGIQQPPLRSGSSYPGWRRTRRDPPALSARI